MAEGNSLRNLVGIMSMEEDEGKCESLGPGDHA